MPSLRPARVARAPVARSSTYWTISRRPLQILAFLLPLIIAYEIGLALPLSIEQQDVEAHRLVIQVFTVFGVSTRGGLYLGGAVILAVLLAWHVLNRDPFDIDTPALGLMAIESIALTVPLIAISQLIARGEWVDTAAGLATPGAPRDFSLWSKWAISVGAGLYEELVFRMLLIAILHTLLVDVARASNLLGTTISVLVAAVCFAAYHPLRMPDGAVDWRWLCFLLIAGVYFGAVYAIRGFGIVVAVHALYDIITFSLNAISDR